MSSWFRIHLLARRVSIPTLCAKASIGHLYVISTATLLVKRTASSFRSIPSRQRNRHSPAASSGKIIDFSEKKKVRYFRAQFEERSSIIDLLNRTCTLAVEIGTRSIESIAWIPFLPLLSQGLHTPQLVNAPPNRARRTSRLRISRVCLLLGNMRSVRAATSNSDGEGIAQRR